jgi:hypothetical protein
MLASNLTKLHTVSKTPIAPVSCIDDEGWSDCLSEVLQKGGAYTPDPGRSPRVITLDFGEVPETGNAKLILRYSLVFGTYNFSNRIIQVKNSSGEWVNAYAGRQIRPAGFPQTFVADLSGLFIYDHMVRLNMTNTVIDYAALDTSPDENVSLAIYPPSSADLHYRGFSSSYGGAVRTYNYNEIVTKSYYSSPEGNFTAYGDILPLLTIRDDKFAIMHHGDEISIAYPYVAVPEGQERDFFLSTVNYYKRSDYLNGGTVLPLPFAAMSDYPYPANESYPSDAEHNSYQAEWNTRQYLK